MKWPGVTVNLTGAAKAVQSFRIASKTFVTLAFVTFLFILLLGMVSYAQKSFGRTSPVSSMKGLASSVSNQFFMDMLSMEVPQLQTDKKDFSFSQTNLMSFMFRLVTDLNPNDPKSMMARELPGMERTTVLRKSATTGDDTPEDYVVNDVKAAASATEPIQEPAAPVQSPPKSAGKNVAFIYHTHSQESFLPELKGVKDPDKAYNTKVNITSVGQRLAQSLEKEGIGAVVSDKNYSDTVKDFKYPLSYKYSLETLREAAVTHPDLEYYFDIHRDSQARNKTTVTIDGKDYAQIYFIIGGKNPNWKKNEEFAGKIHELLEAGHKGLSKGIHAKSSEGNGEYNQSFSENSILIEIGGPYNTLEECYRTADILADAIAQIVMNAEKVDAPQRQKTSAS